MKLTPAVIDHLVGSYQSDNQLLFDESNVVELESELETKEGPDEHDSFNS